MKDPKVDVAKYIDEIKEKLEALGQGSTTTEVAKLLDVTLPTLWGWAEQKHKPNRTSIERIVMLRSILFEAVNGNPEANKILYEIMREDTPNWLAMGHRGILYASNLKWIVTGPDTKESKQKETKPKESKQKETKPRESKPRESKKKGKK
ncbi:MAG: hypothetical protein NUW37_07510 [Planctomycetes bacterium]|nr:hypothetical protein [Planctomycetota bacterium]